jgi:hypothetical protein
MRATFALLTNRHIENQINRLAWQINLHFQTGVQPRCQQWRCAMQRLLLPILAILMLTACSQQSLQPAESTAEAAINRIAPTAKAAVNQVAPTIRALVPTSPPTSTPDPQYPSTLDNPLIACFAPRCGAEDAIILPAGTHYKNTEQDDGTWRFIQVQGGGQVWVLRTQLAKG